MTDRYARSILLPDATIDATNILGVLSMGAAYGMTIRVEVEGGDEARAMARMNEIFASNFNDTE